MTRLRLRRLLATSEGNTASRSGPLTNSRLPLRGTFPGLVRTLCVFAPQVLSGAPEVGPSLALRAKPSLARRFGGPDSIRPMQDGSRVGYAGDPHLRRHVAGRAAKRSAGDRDYRTASRPPIEGVARWCYPHGPARCSNERHRCPRWDGGGAHTPGVGLRSGRRAICVVLCWWGGSRVGRIRLSTLRAGWRSPSHEARTGILHRRLRAKELRGLCRYRAERSFDRGLLPPQ